MASPLIIVLIAFFGSLNLLAVSVVWEYFIRTFEEVKRRPKFIRKGMWHGGTGLTGAAEIEGFVERRRAARSAPPAGAPEAGAPEAGAPEAGAPEAGAPEAGAR